MATKLYGGAYLSSFVDALLEKLTSLLEDDDLSLVERNNLLERLEKSLYDVGAVLDDAELKQFTDKRVNKWLVDLQDALYFADDLLDELSTEAATATQRDPGISASCSRLVDSYIEDSLGCIEKVVGKVESVVARKNYLRLKESAEVNMSSWRTPSTSLVVSSDIFGRDKDKEEIIKLLLADTPRAGSPYTVIPIWGMGGIGKTTLAQLVYSDAKVVEHFDIRVWVCVAENSDPVHITRTIIGAIDPSPYSKNNFDVLHTKLKDKLIGNTFLLVLDDVWHSGGVTWGKLLEPFQHANNGSKILLTTRSEKVASTFPATSQHYRLDLLSGEDCWSVFLKHSSISTNLEQYAILEPIGRNIVEKCKGLPLAVKTLGGLLRNKSDVGDWKKILESEIWELPEDESEIVPALRVSYHYLPSHLKRCFVYCSLYPDDYQFDKDELILHWMAEDLLPPMENNTLENIGSEYFDELVARSFFQSSNAYTGLFVMHDLMHDLAMLFAGKFFFREFGNQLMVDSKTRHLLCNRNPISRFPEPNFEAIHIRTFVCVDDKSDYIKSNCLLKQLMRLRVLAFQNCEIRWLADSIGKCIHLRYLNLSKARIAALPESLCELYNLQTLKLRDCEYLVKLPSRMQDLENLRHLDIRGTRSLKKMPNGMSKLKHLNLLGHYVVGEHEENGIGELGPIDVHGSFCISKLENVNSSSEALKANMGSKKHINILELKWRSDGDTMDVETERDILKELQPHSNLKELSIDGYRGEIFPDWLGLSSFITKLKISYCKNCCELPSLGQLPSLQHLEIFELHRLERIGDEFYKSHEGKPFRSLEILKICSMSCWREWHTPDKLDVFPKLKTLIMKDCPVLKGDLPACLLTLEQLQICDCEELAYSLRRSSKLHTISVLGSENFATVVTPHEVRIENTQQVQSVLECLLHIQPPCFQRLIIERCWSTISISGDYLPASLQYLKIWKCSKLTFPETLEHKFLTEIHVDKCDSVTLFPLGSLPNLKQLTISDCPRLVSLPALGVAAPHLEDLTIGDCPEVDCFGEECLPPSLTTLKIRECQKVERWITSNGFHSEGLTHLTLSRWKEVKSFPREGCLPDSLQSLKLSEFRNLETLDCKGLQHLTSLKELSIVRCPWLENITQENLPASISKLYIEGECPLNSKLREMNDPRIQIKIDDHSDWAYHLIHSDLPPILHGSAV
ncbi:hypothetical protein PIB30_011894 [Stylosanthes scabra]|uniref:Disease resistance RPP13-like protein 1 n=1 Tax=Stylosanthes scabra TaxID=79078 RepID=A0ABU6V4C2_9FABA|nr:hypothetical protein [Stylosanthes scabra]